VSVLIDSDIVIEILRSRDPVIMSQWSTLANSGEDILYSLSPQLRFGPALAQRIPRYITLLSGADLRSE